MPSDEPEVLRAVDLFCGAGGLSWGLVQALEAYAESVGHGEARLTARTLGEEMVSLRATWSDGGDEVQATLTVDRAALVALADGVDGEGGG